MKRPLGIVAVLYVGGVLLGNYFQLPLPCLFAISLAIAAGALLLPRIRLYLLWALLIFTGWMNFVYHTAVISPTDLRVVLTEQPELVSIRGTLAETPSQRVYVTDEGESLRTMARVNVAEILVTGAGRASRTAGSTQDWQPAAGQVAVITPGELPENFFDGRQVEIYGVIAPPPLPIAEGLFDYRAYLKRQEIYFQLKAQSSNDWQNVSSKTASPPLRDRFAKWAKATLAIGRPTVDMQLRLEQALTLGDKTFLTEDVTEPFMRAATYHIFAVDGLRMAILFAIFFKGLRWLRVPRMISGLILIPLLWFYVDLTGWPASAIRAAVMLTIVIAGWMLKRPVDVLNSLFAAALIILLWQPQQLFQAGFQLSFCVVFCIFLVMPTFDKFVEGRLRSDPLLPDKLRPQWQISLLKPIRWILDLFFSSLAAWLGSIPLAAYYFHMVTPVSGPANVIAVPLCAAVLICNSVSLLLSWLPMGATIFNFFGWLFMHWIHASSIWFANWPRAYYYVPAPNLFTILLYYALFIGLATGWLWKVEFRKWKFAALLLLATAWGGQWLHNRSSTRLTVLPLNGGSAIYFDAPGNQGDLLVDCGSEDSVDFVMKPYLRAQGVNGLASAALTVGEVQQIGGFGKLQTLMPIEKVFSSSVRFRSPAYRNIVLSMEATPDRRRVINSGEQLRNWTVSYPAATNHFARADDNALVLRGEIRGTRILLLSTLGKPGQDALLERHADVGADIIITGLPSQTEALNDALLEAIHPALIVIADSQSPATRRANRALRDRLEKHHVPVLYTSDVGAVKISLRQNRWKAETEDGRVWSGP